VLCHSNQESGADDVNSVDNLAADSNSGGTGDDVAVASGTVVIEVVNEQGQSTFHVVETSDDIILPLDIHNSPSNGNNEAQSETSFTDLMPVPHMKLDQSRTKRKRAPGHSAVITSSPYKTTLENKCADQGKYTEKKTRAAAAGKRKGRGRPVAATKKSRVDNTPCNLCGYTYGDPDDPLLSEAWQQCMGCLHWYHETCSSACGFVNDKCEQCRGPTSRY